MKNIFFPVVLLASLVLPAQTKVMTYNIRNSHADHNENSWNNRKASLVALVRKVNPDILGTQEVLADQLKYLKTSLKIVFEYEGSETKEVEQPVSFYYRGDYWELYKMDMEGLNF
jgi:endonuclease/exonuclease/phosphatase family metal-dependent hydrolase